jgi:hypothetical protein
MVGRFRSRHHDIHRPKPNPARLATASFSIDAAATESGRIVN